MKILQFWQWTGDGTANFEVLNKKKFGGNPFSVANENTIGGNLFNKSNRVLF